MDRTLKIFTKSVVYVGGILVTALVIFRGLIPFLWGGGSDLLCLTYAFYFLKGMIY